MEEEKEGMAATAVPIVRLVLYCAIIGAASMVLFGVLTSE